jgi:hypothetical protein
MTVSTRAIRSANCWGSELVKALLLVDLRGELRHPGAALGDLGRRLRQLGLGLLLARDGGLELLRGDGVGPVGGGRDALRLAQRGLRTGQLPLRGLEGGVGLGHVRARVVDPVLEPVDLRVDLALLLARVGPGGHGLRGGGRQRGGAQQRGPEGDRPARGAHGCAVRSSHDHHW